MTDEEVQEILKKMPVKTKVAHCNIHGDFESQCRLRDWWTPCPACRTEADVKRKMEEKAKQDVDEKRRKQEHLRKLLQNSELPLRFHDRTLDTYIAETREKKRALAFAKEYAETFETVYKTGRCALFIGRPGTGKTHLAAGIGLYLMNHDYSVMFTKVTCLIRRIRSTWNRASVETETQAIAAFMLRGDSDHEIARSKTMG
jgi:DNA replication protein DnaC